MTALLEEGGIADARRNAEWIVEDVLGLSKTELYAHGDVSLTQNEFERIEELAERRLTREPVQYILGYTEFFGLKMSVSPDVLIPRPETEEVVEECLRLLNMLSDPWVLDVGTGSGAIALAIKHKRPDAEVFASDISECALDVATANAEALGLDVTFIHADMLDPSFAQDVTPAFDLVVANPPYIPNNEYDSLEPEVRAYEPNVALFVPDDDPLRFYRALAALAPVLLKPKGILVVETHADFGSQVDDLFRSAGLAEVTLKRDLSGHPRVVTGYLQEQV